MGVAGLQYRLAVINTTMGLTALIPPVFLKGIRRVSSGMMQGQSVSRDDDHEWIVTKDMNCSEEPYRNITFLLDNT